jgi:perosamine synthetase
MIVPFHRPYISEEDITAVSDAMRSGWLTMGPKTREFEEAFRNFVGSGCAVAVNSATAGLHLSLVAAGVKPGDEVIIPAITFAATAEAVCYCGGRPVMVDVEGATRNIDFGKIEEAVTDKTRAIIPMHYGGQPCDMDPIMSIAAMNNCFVIEDAAHALPSVYGGLAIGSIADATVFSFYATKTITTGEGGMITTDREDWASRMRRLRLHGIDRDAWQRLSSGNMWAYEVVEVGYKYNPTDMASAMGITQLAKCDEMFEKRKAVADRYCAGLKDMDTLRLPVIKPGRQTSWYLFSIDLNIDALKISRDEFIMEMRKRGIELSVHFIPLYRFAWYKKYVNTPMSFAECEWVFARTVSFPIYPGMETQAVDYVIDNAADVLAKNRR